jgi:hypothetical protein
MRNGFQSAAIFYHVSKLLNFLVTTLPRSMPRRSTMRCARSGCDEPLKTLMFGILLWRIKFLGPEQLDESVGTHTAIVGSSVSHITTHTKYFKKAYRRRGRASAAVGALCLWVRPCVCLCAGAHAMNAYEPALHAGADSPCWQRAEGGFSLAK